MLETYVTMNTWSTTYKKNCRVQIILNISVEIHRNLTFRFINEMGERKNKINKYQQY